MRAKAFVSTKKKATKKASARATPASSMLRSPTRKYGAPEITEVRNIRVGANGQVSIGKKWAGREIQVQFLSNGSARIVPGKFVSSATLEALGLESDPSLEEFNQWEIGHEEPTKTSDQVFAAVRALRKTK